MGREIIEALKTLLRRKHAVSLLGVDDTARVRLVAGQNAALVTTLASSSEIKDALTELQSEEKKA